LKQTDIVKNRWGRLVDKKKHENGLRIYSRKNIKKIFKDNKASPWKKGKSGRKPSTMKHHHRRGHDTR
jgi:hypothetical protein